MSTKLLETVKVSNKHIIEEIVHQVGHLPELYEDARSKNIKRSFLLFPSLFSFPQKKISYSVKVFCVSEL
jgi:hypothetical protein